MCFIQCLELRKQNHDIIMLLRDLDTKYSYKKIGNVCKWLKILVSDFEDFLDKLQKDDFLRIMHWNLSQKNIRKAITNSKKLCDRINNLEICEMKKFLLVNDLLIGECIVRLDLKRNLMKDFAVLENQLIDRSKIKTGDIIIAIGPKPEDKSYLVYNYIKLASRSTAYHTQLAIRQGNLDIVDSHGKYKKVTRRNFKIKSNVIYVVLRPIITESNTNRMVGFIDECVKSELPYAFFRYPANTFGTLLMKIRALFDLTGILKKDGVHCSEFVNDAFLSVGINLTSKMEKSKSIFPSDFLESSLLKRVGLIFDQSEKNRAEIMRFLEHSKI